jgi:hypothetical protein
MPKLLVAVMSCHRCDYRDPRDPDVRDWWEATRCKDPDARRSGCRATWLKRFAELGIDYKIFLGRQTKDVRGRQVLIDSPRPPLEDEVFVDTGDLYHDNTHKFQAMCRWALANGYDYILRTDDDIYIYPDRILATEWAQHDYAGAWNGSVVFFHPGGALFLSRRAMEIVSNAKVDHWADDAWLGKVMGNNQIPTHEIKSIHLPFGEEYVVNPDKIPIDHPWSALHSCTPAVMKILSERPQ